MSYIVTFPNSRPDNAPPVDSDTLLQLNQTVTMTAIDGSTFEVLQPAGFPQSVNQLTAQITSTQAQLADLQARLTEAQAFVTAHTTNTNT